jgi:RNA 3'-terminal phosphate cyclase (ATP)
VECRAEPLVIDGSHGEGGGQILRTALGLAALTGRPLTMENIRARRPKPGLAVQHLTAVRALAAVCRAELSGDILGARRIEFRPRSAVVPGEYAFDVAAARAGGSAGATSLVLQAVLLPLAFAPGTSRVVIAGGTHMAFSPPFDYLQDVWLPFLARLGIRASIDLRRSGWFPIGQGEIVATIEGLGPDRHGGLSPVELTERGRLNRVTGHALAANLPDHVAWRMAGRATELLGEHAIEVDIDAETTRAACAGAGIFLTAHYENVHCGFNAPGERGVPAERVADAAVAALLSHRAGGAALESHLADQVLVPLALASGPSCFTAERVTRHLSTNAWVIEQFGLAGVTLEEVSNGTGRVTVAPRENAF